MKARYETKQPMSCAEGAVEKRRAPTLCLCYGWSVMCHVYSVQACIDCTPCGIPYPRDIWIFRNVCCSEVWDI